LELGSLDLVARYVAQGFGVGLGVHLPGVGPAPGTRALPLEDFPALPFCALWTGRLTPLAQHFLDEARSLATSLDAG
jgi:DNA-binding transcriptional LysR family regulator